MNMAGRPLRRMRRNAGAANDTAPMRIIITALGPQVDRAIVGAMHDIGLFSANCRSAGKHSAIVIDNDDFYKMCSDFEKHSFMIGASARVDPRRMAHIRGIDPVEMGEICLEYGVITFPHRDSFGTGFMLAPPSDHWLADRDKVELVLEEARGAGARIVLPSKKP
jgi:hypothetical protein